jgi:hypothetical protein
MHPQAEKADPKPTEPAMETLWSCRCKRLLRRWQTSWLDKKSVGVTRKLEQMKESFRYRQASNWRASMFEEREKAFPSGPQFRISVLVALGNQMAWRQTGAGDGLSTFWAHCWRVWPSTEWAWSISSFLYCYFPYRDLYVCISFISFMKTNHCGAQLHALILAHAKKRPYLRLEHLHLSLSLYIK